MIRKALVTLAAFMCVNTAALADGHGSVTQTKDGMVYGDHPVSVAPDTGLANRNYIFNNIGWKYPHGSFNCCYAYAVEGGQGPIGHVVWFAVPFTPVSNTVAKQIAVPVGYTSGTNKVVVALYDDNGGVPGNQLTSGALTALPAFPECCAIATIKINQALTAGATYWVAVTTDGTDTDTFANWAASDTDEVNPANVVQSNSDGTGWGTVQQRIVTPAFAVIGEKN